MIKIEIPEVTECQASRCAYNANGHCHAQAITIGDGDVPDCDTFLDRGPHVRDVSRPAGVGACKVASCRHNDDLECAAPSIRVGTPRCLTFEPA